MKKSTFLFVLPILLLAIAITSFSTGRSQTLQTAAAIDSIDMNELGERLRKSGVFRYPLDDYLPEIPVTDAPPPRSNAKEGHHCGEDSFAPAGTPVYAIGDGIISYSGRARGYGWLIIIDHPDQNVYSLYGHLSSRGWKKDSGHVEKGELIAYLATGREGETMVSHIHFGMRMGQWADYPPFGDTRWYAGYTKVLPSEQGWFKASKIIGETESMRNWHSYLRKRDNVISGRNLHSSDFKTTSGSYCEKDDLDQVVREEFGDDYKLADWEEVRLYSANVEGWADSLGLAEGEGKELLISSDGYRMWLGRQFFLARFNHNKPDYFLAFDAIEDNLVCLGSWLDMSNKVLAIRK